MAEAARAAGRWIDETDNGTMVVRVRAGVVAGVPPGGGGAAADYRSHQRHALAPPGFRPGGRLHAARSRRRPDPWGLVAGSVGHPGRAGEPEEPGDRARCRRLPHGQPFPPGEPGGGRGAAPHEGDGLRRGRHGQPRVRSHARRPGPHPLHGERAGRPAADAVLERGLRPGQPQGRHSRAGLQRGAGETLRGRRRGRHQDRPVRGDRRGSPPGRPRSRPR